MWQRIKQWFEGLHLVLQILIAAITLSSALGIGSFLVSPLWQSSSDGQSVPTDPRQEPVAQGGTFDAKVGLAAISGGNDVTTISISLSIRNITSEPVKAILSNRPPTITTDTGLTVRMRVENGINTCPPYYELLKCVDQRADSLITIRPGEAPNIILRGSSEGRSVFDLAKDSESLTIAMTLIFIVGREQGQMVNLSIPNVPVKNAVKNNPA